MSNLDLEISTEMQKINLRTREWADEFIFDL